MGKERLKENDFRHINCILGDLISLYDPQDQTANWWADRLYAFRETVWQPPADMPWEPKKEFVLHVDFLQDAYPGRRYQLLEAYLWSQPVCDLLLRPLGFLEGNYIVLQPEEYSLIQPNIEAPWHTIRFPHLGFGQETVVDLWC